MKKWQARPRARARPALAKVGATKIYDYTVTNNGVAAQLTRPAGRPARRRRRASSPLTQGRAGPARRPRTRPTSSASTRRAASGRSSAAAANAGAGVVVGVLDTGIWPESTAFAGGTGIPVPADWHGKCVAGEQFSVKPTATTS